MEEYYKALPAEMPVVWFDLQASISGVRADTGGSTNKNIARRILPSSPKNLPRSFRISRWEPR